ncbi:MAG: ornithine cyclodeaminase family protein [Paracoccaceae bacterium]
MQIYDAEAVHTGLPWGQLVADLISHHLRDVEDRGSAVLEQPGANGSEHGPNHFLALPAWQKGRAIGAKLVSVFPENEHNGSGLPSVQGVYVLFSGGNGQVRAVIDGAAITERKTAADSAAGAHFLARKDAKRMLMVGAGVMAGALIPAHLAVRPSIQEVTIWNRSRARADKLATSLDLQGVSVTVTDDLEAATKEADVISCATMATRPLIHGKWLKPGAHLDLVGSFVADMQECDTEAMTRGTLFLDSQWSAVADSGEIQTALAAGAISAEDLRADLFQLARSEHPGRTSADEITVFKNGGGGHLDLMVAQILLGDS